MSKSQALIIQIVQKSKRKNLPLRVLHNNIGIGITFKYFYSNLDIQYPNRTKIVYAEVKLLTKQIDIWEILMLSIHVASRWLEGEVVKRSSMLR